MSPLRYHSHVNKNNNKAISSHPRLATNPKDTIKHTKKHSKSSSLNHTQQENHVHFSSACDVKFDNEEDDEDDDYEMGPHLLSRDENDDNNDNDDDYYDTNEFGENDHNHYFDIWRENKSVNLSNASFLTDDDISAAANGETISCVYSAGSFATNDHHGQPSFAYSFDSQNSYNGLRKYHRDRQHHRHNSYSTAPTKLHKNYDSPSRLSSRPLLSSKAPTSRHTNGPIFRSSSNNSCDNAVGISYPIAATETSESRAIYLAKQRQRRYYGTTNTATNKQLQQKVIKPGLPVNVLWQDQEYRQDGSSLCISHVTEFTETHTGKSKKEEQFSIDSTIGTTNHDGSMIPKNHFKPLKEHVKDSEDDKDSDCDLEISKANNQMMYPLNATSQEPKPSDLVNNTNKAEKKQGYRHPPQPHGDNFITNNDQIIPYLQTSPTEVSLSTVEEDDNNNNNNTAKINRKHHHHKRSRNRQNKKKMTQKDPSDLTLVSSSSSLAKLVVPSHHGAVVDTKCTCNIM